MDEMLRRGYNPDKTWYHKDYRGKVFGEQEGGCNCMLLDSYLSKSESGINIYPEHNKEYYQECIENLKAKGIETE